MIDDRYNPYQVRVVIDQRAVEAERTDWHWNERERVLTVSVRTKDAPQKRLEAAWYGR